MNKQIEVVVIDKENNRKIYVAIYHKPISELDRFPNELAKELFNFLFKNAGKLIGEPKKNFRDTNFFPRLLNDCPFERVIKKVEFK